MYLSFTQSYASVVTDVKIGRGFFKDKAVQEAISALSSRVVLIFDDALKLYVEPLVQAVNPVLIPVQAGESCKTRRLKEEIEDRLLEQGLASDCVIVACGGGTVLDLAGFVAATFCRGVPLCFFPSTLLAMVDAGVGGKNGINAKGRKNCIGTIYHPRHIFVDLQLLASLPAVEVENGCVELLKMALVGLMPFYDDPQAVIGDAIAAKMAIVQKSAREPRVRDILNFGHTFGHAYETLEEFEVPHGRAVALGMLAESYIAMKMNVLSESAFSCVHKRIVDVCPVYMNRAHSVEKWMKALESDKKNRHGNIHMVLLAAEDRVFASHSIAVDSEYILPAIEWLQTRFVRT